MITLRGLMSVLAVSAFVALTAACSSVSPPASSLQTNVAAVQQPLTVDARYQPAPTMTILVVPAYVPGREIELIALARTECAGRSFCSVGFWSSDEAAPRRLKMSSQQVSDRIVQFAVNASTGLNKATWNCTRATRIVGDCV